MLVTCIISRVGQNHIYTVHIRYFWQGNHEMYGHIRCIYTVLANPNNIWLGGTGVCCTHVQFPGTVLALSWWHRCFCCTVLAQCVSWHSLGTVLVAQVFVAQSWHSVFPGTVLALSWWHRCLLHTRCNFPVATSNGFACTLLPVFFDVKHHSLPELAVPCSERQQHPAGSRRKGSILT